MCVPIDLSIHSLRRMKRRKIRFGKEQNMRVLSSLPQLLVQEDGPSTSGEDQSPETPQRDIYLGIYIWRESKKY